jgi:hypothetical protein
MENLKGFAGSQTPRKSSRIAAAQPQEEVDTHCPMQMRGAKFYKPYRHCQCYAMKPLMEFQEMRGQSTDSKSTDLRNGDAAKHFSQYKHI